MRFFTGVMVWGSIIIVFLGNIVALGFCGYRLYFAYHDKQSDTWLAFTVILVILFLIITCLFIFLRKVDQSSSNLVGFIKFDLPSENSDRHCTDRGGLQSSGHDVLQSSLPHHSLPLPAGE